MTPILFLDIDGVLNSGLFLKSCQWEKGRGDEYQIDPKGVAVLNEIHRLFPGMEWVLSSTWRYMHTPSSMTDILAGKGFLGKITSATPKQDMESRGEEIVLWLNENDATERPFAILDDNGGDYMAPVEDRLILTTFQSGIQPYHSLAVKQLLMKQGVVPG